MKRNPSRRFANTVACACLALREAPPGSKLAPREATSLTPKIENSDAVLETQSYSMPIVALTESTVVAPEDATRAPCRRLLCPCARIHLDWLRALAVLVASGFHPHRAHARDMMRLARRGKRFVSRLSCILISCLCLLLTLLLSPPATFADDPPDPGPAPTGPDPILSTLTYRDAFLPPGTPSVALHADETAMLWNPAGIAMSGAYYLGYSWKGTYYDDDIRIQSHYALTKARGFGIGFMRDDFSKGVKTTTLFSIAPPITNKFSLGWTGKWRGGFNFDVGMMAVLGRHLSFGFVGRNVRYRPNVRRYWESGLAIYVVPGRFTCHFDVVVEDSPWRTETGLGGGINLNLEKGVSVTASYFTDGEGHGITRAGLRLSMPGNTAEGEYTQYTNDFQTMGVRLASRNP